jgi:hypothetical protein
VRNFPRIVLGGQDSTRGQLGLALEIFARHPAQRAQLASDPTLAENATEEVLRGEPHHPDAAMNNAFLDCLINTDLRPARVRTELDFVNERWLRAGTGRCIVMRWRLGRRHGPW